MQPLAKVSGGFFAMLAQHDNPCDAIAPPKDAKPRKRALKQRRELFQYDGCAFIGRIVVDPSGKAKAFDGARKRLGIFPDFCTAMAAISAAHMSAMGSTIGRDAKRASKLLSRPSAHG
jgi:hypothetical protein